MRSKRPIFLGTSVMSLVLLTVSWVLNVWFTETRADEAVVFGSLAVFFVAILVFVVFGWRRHASVWVGVLQAAVLAAFAAIPVFHEEPGEEPMVGPLIAAVLVGVLAAATLLTAGFLRHRRPATPARPHARVPARSLGTPDPGTGVAAAAVVATRDMVPTCAACDGTFAWETAYATQETPGSAAFAPPGHGDFRPRVFCPHCGALVVDWLVTRQQDFDRWTWHGNNEATNRNIALPPSPLSPWCKFIPEHLRPGISAPMLNVEAVREWERREAKEEKARSERRQGPFDVPDLVAKGDVDGLVAALAEDDLKETHKAAVHALEEMGVPIVDTLVAAFETATSKWKDRNLRGGLAEVSGRIGDLRVLKHLLLLVGDDIPFVRIAAHRALTSLKDRAGEGAFIQELLKAKAPAVMEALRLASERDPDQEHREHARSLLNVIAGIS